MDWAFSDPRFRHHPLAMAPIDATHRGKICIRRLAKQKKDPSYDWSDPIADLGH